MSVFVWVVGGVAAWLAIMVSVGRRLRRERRRLPLAEAWDAASRMEYLGRERLGVSPVEAAARAVHEAPVRLDGDGSRAQRLAEKRKDGHR